MLETLRSFRRRLLDWYHQNRRDLPWRPPPKSPPGMRPDPYHVLVSELMLQQTQVATVVPYFRKFVARFPSLADLAAADEQEVLRLWQGLGYYSRARNLQETARRAVRDHGGELPPDVESLLGLPGIGRYTAGAVASIAFGRGAPILDGNVIRVLCRLDKVATDPREPATKEVLWARAAQVLPKEHPGDFNSALMELGALVCTPRGPKCLFCPVRAHCEAQAAGVQEAIPPPKKAKPTPLHARWTFCIRRERGGEAEWLVEQRPAKGRWAGMWQFVTVEAGKGKPTNPLLTERLPVTVRGVKRIGEVTHGLTHRRYTFDVFRCETAEDAPPSAADPPRRWVTLAALEAFPLPKPHLRIVEMLRG